MCILRGLCISMNLKATGIWSLVPLMISLHKHVFGEVASKDLGQTYNTQLGWRKKDVSSGHHLMVALLSLA